MQPLQPLSTLNQHLLDVQSIPDTRGIAIQQVGVKNVEMPLYIIQQDGGTQMVAASVNLSVSLNAESKGTHLSRFIIQLAEASVNKAFCYNLREYLTQTQQALGAQNAYMNIDFRYFIQKPAPVTKMSAPMAVACRFIASLEGGIYKFSLGVELPIATLCPCSKAISDYGAHNQRAYIRAIVDVDTRDDQQQVLWLEDLITALDECASCPVYPILKRADEKYVTERAYDNPKFVEDVMRDCIAVMRQTPSVLGFDIEVDAQESIHGHNAWAQHKEVLAEALVI